MWDRGGKTAPGAERRNSNGDGNMDGGGTGTRTRTGMSTRAGMRARTEAGTWTRIEMEVEGRESLGTFEVVIEAIETGRKTREGGATPTSNK